MGPRKTQTPATDAPAGVFISSESAPQIFACCWTTAPTPLGRPQGDNEQSQTPRLGQQVDCDRHNSRSSVRLGAEQGKIVAAHSMKDIAMEISLTTILSAIVGHLADTVPVIISLIGGAISSKFVDTIVIAIAVSFLAELFLPLTN